MDCRNPFCARCEHKELSLGRRIQRWLFGKTKQKGGDSRMPSRAQAPTVTSNTVRVGDILQGNKTKMTAVVTFVGLKDVVVRKANGNKRKYRHAAFKGYTNLSAQMRKTLAKAELT